MGLGIRNKLINIYIIFLYFKFSVRKLFLGFENATKLLYSLDKRAIIHILRKNGATIGENCDIESPLIFHNCKDFQKLSIGDNCHIGKNVFLDLRNEIILKDNVVISFNCKIITHLDMGQSKLSKLYPPTQKKVILNDDCYIGANSVILMGVELCENCLVSAGSVILKSFPANSFIAGVPSELKCEIPQDK